MEVKVVIAPSPEMVSLVQSVLAVFTANNLVDKVAEMQKLAAEQKAPVFENGGVTEKVSVKNNITEKFNTPFTSTSQIETPREAISPEPIRKRRTKAEIEAEKQQSIGTAYSKEAIEEFEKEVTAQLAEGQQVESISLSSTEGLIEIIEKPTAEVQVPSVVKLRKMTTNRMPLIPDVPALLSEFDENSVTALAKDSEKVVAFYNRLLTISPLTAADNE